jgi:hypothetical protein
MFNSEQRNFERIARMNSVQEPTEPRCCFSKYISNPGWISTLVIVYWRKQTWSTQKPIGNYNLNPIDWISTTATKHHLQHRPSLIVIGLLIRLGRPYADTSLSPILGSNIYLFRLQSPGRVRQYSQPSHYSNKLLALLLYIACALRMCVRDCTREMWWWCGRASLDSMQHDGVVAVDKAFKKEIK